MPTFPSGLQLPYALVDVFAEHPLEGNMLAIFTDATGLSTEQMQALARETNLAETTFFLPDEPAAAAGQSARVRIFTTEEELPFAGHPTLGTASWLFWNHPVLRGMEVITLQLNAGPVSVRFRAQEGHSPAPGVFGTMRQQDPIFGHIHDSQQVAQALGLSVDDLDPALPVQTVSTGLPFCIVPLRSTESLRRLSIPQALARAYLAATDAKFFFCLTRSDPASTADFQARMQFYNGEDPATGSASGCAIAFLVRYGVVPSAHPTVFEQGIEICRPSRIHVSASLEPRGSADPLIRDVSVGGRTIAVASGLFLLP